MSAAARRELGAAVLACLVGAVLVLVGLGRAWIRIEVTGGPLLPDSTVSVRGGDLVPGVRALALVGIAGVVGLAATRGRGRQAVGAVLVMVGTAATGLAVEQALDTKVDALAVNDASRTVEVGAVSSTPWPWVVVLGAALLVIAGVLALLRGRGWSALSDRYEAPVAFARGGREPAPAATPTAAPAEAPTEAPTVAPTDKALWDDLDRGEDPTNG